MRLGLFYPALAVTDLDASLSFYTALGFSLECAGPPEKWAMLEKDGVRIGLYEGMFDNDMLTFNPPDARALEATLKNAGVEIESSTSGDSGPCSLMVKDPDGRVVLLDQITD